LADADGLKRAAAERAVELVEDGMVVGLGTGSTTAHFITGLGRRVAAGGLRVRGVPTSVASAALARAAGVALVDQVVGTVDLAIDGADEIDPARDLIKGHGGALFREKMVAEAATRFVVVADASKLVDRLGQGEVPVEVAPFLWRRTAARVEGLGGQWRLRGSEDEPYRTDNGNLVLDVRFPGGISDPGRLGAALKGLTGVLDHGLFVGMARACIVATATGVTVLGSLS
jgi:ribose 5-phosphate isomerase A